LTNKFLFDKMVLVSGAQFRTDSITTGKETPLLGLLFFLAHYFRDLLAFLYFRTYTKTISGLVLSWYKMGRELVPTHYVVLGFNFLGPFYIIKI